MNYEQFLKNKIIISEDFGFEPQELSPKLHLHQPAIVEWALKGGRRAIFASFGLGKTFMQLEIERMHSKSNRFTSRTWAHRRFANR